MKTKPHIFKTFPEFSQLKLSDKDAYESLIAGYPALSDISFPVLYTLWSTLGDVSVSQLGECIVISYYLPGSDKASGLSVVGTEGVDEAIATVLDWQKGRGDEPCLAHVPEFVTTCMRFPELYTFEQERDHDECILPVSKLSSLDQLIRHKRWKIRRFLTEVEQSRVVLTSLNLDVQDNKELLISHMEEWRGKGVFNFVGMVEENDLVSAINLSEELGYENVCLYIDGVLHGYLIYQLHADDDYVIINYGRFSYSMPHLFEFAVYKFAQWFDDIGVKHANIDSDFGLPLVRSTKLAIGPENFFRKYTIRPTGI